jgi:predicted Zn finger-like uncharacterized protein
MEAQTIHCPNCQALVPAADINITALVAKCGNCNSVFPLPLETVQPADERQSLPELGCPGGVVREIGPGGELFIRRSWFQPMLFFLAFFCVFWDGFLIFWYSMAFAHAPAGNMMLLPLLFPLMHVAVGVGLTYFVIAGFCNSTRILIDGECVHVRHQPLPWRGNQDVPRGEIRGIEMAAGWGQNRQPMFSLCANKTDGRQVVLVSNINYNQARYIGHQMAEYLSVGFIGCEPSVFPFPLPRWLRGRQGSGR